MTDNPKSNENASKRIELISGWRQVSLGALKEKIETQFRAEAPPDVLTIPEEERRERLREAADYILETEVIRLPRADKLALLDSLYAMLFQYGPLDPFLREIAITELTLDGLHQAFIRRGAAEPERIPVPFETMDDLNRVLARMLAPGGRTYSDAEPFIEVGVRPLGRPGRLTIAAPPVSPELHIELRLHPPEPLTLLALAEQGFLTAAVAKHLTEAIGNRTGIMLAGDVGSGKTTLLNALLPLLPGSGSVVERAAELHILADMTEYTGPDFSEQIEMALALRPPWLVLDEVRFDEGNAVWACLTADPRPVCLFALRGATRADRLYAAFSMSMRRADPTLDDAAIAAALVAALPLVVTLGHRDGRPRVLALGRWEFVDGRAKLNPITP